MSNLGGHSSAHEKMVRLSWTSNVQEFARLMRAEITHIMNDTWVPGVLELSG